MVASQSAVLTRKKPVSSAVGAELSSRSQSLSAEWIFGALLCGTILGWSAPGMEQWWLAWIGLSPLFFAVSRMKTAKSAAVLGTVFGTAFNLVYLQWYLQVRDSAWTAVFALAPSVSAIAVWLSMALWQGAFIGLVCFALHRLPLCAGFLPIRSSNVGGWQLPLYVVAPILWVGIVEKLCNLPGLLGVPWSMLEYTQYKQVNVLQIASVIGGSGLACAIVLCNLVIASGLASFVGAERFRFGGRRSAFINVAAAVTLLSMIPLFGDLRLTERSVAPNTVSVAALQGNLESSVHGVSATKSIERGMRLAIQSKVDLCVWPEWSAPIDWTVQKDFVQFFAREAKLNKQAWVLGTFDTAGNTSSRRYNSVGVVRADGSIVDKAYHKQYLVPFGEYVPDWIYYSPLMALFDPHHQAEHGMLADNHGAVLDTGVAKIGPLICFENCLPSLPAGSVRNGAQLLVDSSNTSWFKYSNVLGKQLIAFSVLRAVENHRSFVFSTVLGPSAIIDPNGRIVQQAFVDQAVAVESKVPLETDITPFTRLCTF